ncbi:zinc finger matrin-type protein CG9776-like isoform X1 [Phymastichus coffea]|uniref:zinc finger matrin-type protein CG9776-like isoform X1 n=1 Tax=Phymastichus coffea TaxID=108790 RepID=UPI00273CDABD|nr:zinc finger matrin-type protein CG9776-like isoform X1 [Phymastichus coffea]XP_058797674.1 zinc finger matrin-type protein CG9776-like isoform X1 [Phymastichus coffea]XP_058797675.1 zinc finger matrin-type protein CG9776-like isoform X1 [Phymastichus coffea]XP_058797676.1 zinc finger matrin-type protein CG9776-like isoform X1 [Phymastichus coffea]
MMESESRRRGPRSPSEESDGLRRRSKKYDRSPSPRRRYRRSRSRSRSSEREMISRRKENSKESDWKSTMPSNKASNPPNTSYPPPVIARYNQAPPPPNTSQPPPPIPYGQGYGNYNYNYNAAYPEYNAANYQPQAPTGYRNDYPPPANWQGNMPYSTQQQAAAVAAQAAAAAAAAVAPTQQQRVVDPTVAAAQALLAATGRPEEAKKEAIAAELKQQKATLAKQREEYLKKTVRLQRELEILRKQYEEIDNEGGRENNRIIKENQKLQVEIQNKMKSIHNVIDMLTGIIGDKVTVDDLKVKYKPDAVNRSKSPKEDAKKIAESPRSEDKEDERPAYNFVHYDPEMHWCKTCDIFPKTAKEYLNHLHCNEHKETCLERKIVDMPWHDDKHGGPEKEVPFYPGLPTKRTPIKGLQFFSPATAWYCRLCNAWIGDLHCASLHLKSRRHSENYSRFVEQNPHWETDWMADREKAFSDEKNKQIQMEIQKQKEEVPVAKPKKSKKAKKNKKKSKKRKTKSSNSESSSDTDSNESDTNNGNGPSMVDDPSKSIRVAMRNKGKSSNQVAHHHEVDMYEYKGSANLPSDNHHNKLKPKPEDSKLSDNTDGELQAWGPKEPSKPFWIKKDEESKVAPQPVPVAPVKPPEDIPKPHMGFWTKQQVQPVKTDKDKDDERDSSRSTDKYKDDRREYGGKWDKRDDDYKRSYRDDRYRDDRRRGGRDREYYDSRSGRYRGSDSPRHSREYSPKRGFDKYGNKRRGDDDSNDEKKSNDKSKKDSSNSNSKKGQSQVMKGKLPFIGRLPLFKKKDDPKLPEKEVAPLPYAQSKFEDTPKVPSDIINPPGVVHVPKLATPVVLPTTQPKGQMKILVAPPPPILNEKNDKNKKDDEKSNGMSTAEPVDMEIEDQSEDTVIEQNVDPIKEVVPNTDLSKPPPVIPNTSLPPPGYPPKADPLPTSFTPQGPPPPFVTGVANTFLHPTNQPPPTMQSMPYMHQMQIPPPNMYSAPPPTIPVTSEMPSVMATEEPVAAVEGEKRADGAPLPVDLQEALDIIFPKEETPEEKAARLAAEQAAREAQETSIMYGSMYSMLGCVGYGPDYMDQPPPEITQQEPDESAGPDDLKMLGIDEGDTIL